MFIKILTKDIRATNILDINRAVNAHNIPDELIINIDQTLLPFFLIMQKRGNSTVSVAGNADYRQVTGTNSTSLVNFT